MFDRVRNTPLEMYLVIGPSPHTHQKTIRPQVKKKSMKIKDDRNLSLIFHLTNGCDRVWNSRMLSFSSSSDFESSWQSFFFLEI